MTLMREMIVLWCCLAIGRMAACSTPSIRYFTQTASSCVSMWMSDARRWIAVKIVESTSRIIGLMSLVSRSTVRLSSPPSSSLSSWIWKLSVASSRTRCELSLFLRIESIADRAPDHHAQRRGEQDLELVDHREVARVRDDDDQRAPVAPVRDEPVAQHQVGRNRPEQVVVDQEVLEVGVVEAVPLGQVPGLRLLLRRRRRRLRAPVDVQGRQAGWRPERDGVLHDRGSPVASIGAPATDVSWKSGM